MDNKLKTKKSKIKSQKHCLLLCILYFLSFVFTSPAQQYTRVDTIPVKVNGKWLKNPWVGGHNYIQISDIDINFDGKKDLFVFDRSGHKVTTYINKGTPNTVDYVDSSFKYASKFPHMEDWVLLRDYNCDGKPDIFTYAISVGGIKVWKNTSSGGNLQFTLQTSYLKSDYTPYNPSDPLSNLYVSRVDIPTIDDIDGDGDLDILTFDFSTTQMEYHINQSVEKGYGCDSLIFNLDVAGGCWGNFSEDLYDCNVTLQSCRPANSDSLSHAHPFFPPFAREEEWANALSHHMGNCSLCIDMDGDGDKEILLGQISCCNMALLTNGGSKTAANMIAKNDSFPSSIPVRETIFPCGYFLDVDNDNKRDLIVAPNAPNSSIDNESIWFYKNTGTDNAPVFSRLKRNLFQEDMIEVGEGADPVFFDFDGDGLTDLLISNYTMVKDSCPASPNSYNVFAFKNIGTPTNPKFDLVSTDYANLSTLLPNVPSKHLTFGDVDNDGDMDMYIGDYGGNIHYFNNTAGPGVAANFVYMGMVRDAANALIDIGSFATPQLIDVDRDKDLDLVIGEQAGNLNFYRNTGTATTPVFSFVSNTFGGVNVYKPCCTGYSAPFMFDSAGKYNLFVGSDASRNYPASGWIWYYKNIDATLSGSFILADSMYNKIWEGQRMIVHGADINADGYMDLVIGNYAGGVAIYMGNRTAVSVPEQPNVSFDFTVFPNPSFGASTIHIFGFLPGEKYTLCIYNLTGEIIYSQHMIRPETKVDMSLSPGVYSYEMHSKNFSKTKKLVVLK